MDTSVPTLPVLKIFENGAWVTVHTEQSKIDALLAKTVFEQSKVIDELTNGLDTKIDELSGNVNTLQQTVAKESNATINKNAIIDALLNRINEFDEKITPYLYDECSVEEIEHMFEPIIQDGYILIPSNAFSINETMPITVFEAITNYTLK
jgi:hypothetical protein